MKFDAITQTLKTNFGRLMSSRGGASLSGRFIAVDWTDPSVAVHELTICGHEITVGQQLQLQWPDDVQLFESPENAGRWLHQQLRNAGFDATDAIVSLPRRSVSLKLLELPAIADNELAAAVGLHLEGRADGAIEDLAFDFIPHAMNGSATRHVMLATMPRETVSQIDAVLRHAGLTVRASGVGELAIDALHSSDQRSDELVLSVLANYAKVEFVLSSSGVPVASHSTRMPDNDPAEVGVTIPQVAARMIAALPDSLRQRALGGVWLLGPHAQRLEQAARSSCDWPVSVISTGHDDAIRTLALATAISRRAATLNFRSPRRPADTKAIKRKQIIRYAIGVAGLLGVLTLWLHDQKSALREDVESHRQAISRLNDLNERGQSTLDAWRYVDEWQRSTIDWPKEVAAFNEHLPSPGNAYLTRLQLEKATGTDHPVIRVDGLAKNTDVAIAFNRSLTLSNRKYELHPHGIEPANRDTAFRSAFRVEAVVLSPDP